MFRKSIKLSIVAILLACSNLYALAPDNMLKDGIRAFDLANWEESREILNRFMETWPQHEKYNEALYYHTLASAKTIDSRTEEYRASLGKELTTATESLAKNLPEKDISEAIAAIKISQNTNKPETWKELAKLTPAELKHYLTRKWHPTPSVCPFETLEWEKEWTASNHKIDSELLSEISLLKLSALWQIIISPMVKQSSEDKLRELDALPLEKVFKDTLFTAFRKGNPEQKRKTAIFGYHFDYFNHNKLNTNNQIKSRWLRYLNSRGISSRETWSPK